MWIFREFPPQAILEALRDETMHDPRERIEIAQTHAFYRPFLLGKQQLWYGTSLPLSCKFVSSRASGKKSWHIIKIAFLLGWVYQENACAMVSWVVYCTVVDLNYIARHHFQSSRHLRIEIADITYYSELSLHLSTEIITKKFCEHPTYILIYAS